MGINRVKDHKGLVRIQLSKRWPDGSRFRRYFLNATVAKKTLARIEEAIAMGTWRDLQEELRRGVQADMKVAEFAPLYLEEYCKARNSDLTFKKQNVDPIVEILGSVPLNRLTRSHAHEFVAKRSAKVGPATVNRGLAVLKNMLTFALEKGFIDAHPLLRFRMLPEDQKVLRVMTLEEERRLVQAVAEVDHTIGAYVALLGETGLRKAEGLNLKWVDVNFAQQIVAVEHSKSRRPRYVPLSDYAIQWLQSLVRVIHCPYVFVNLQTREQWKDPRGPFDEGKKAAELEWVGFHDLRYFRATQWVKLGIDLRTVQELLGHSTITTTMRYAHFAPAHAARSILQAQKKEIEEWEQTRAKSGRKD